MDDADAMARVHAAAVHGLAAGHYDPRALAAWSPPGTGPRARLRARLGDGAHLFLVALDGDGVAGFAALRTDVWVVHAVYVHPRAAGQGVGRRLLAALEAEARARRIGHLQLDASLNAEGFYRAQGYRAAERRTCALPDGYDMAAVRMVKRLDLEPDA